MDFNFSQWVYYYKKNQSSLNRLDWEDPYRLSPSEYQTICSSIQQFQIGESSEGKYLFNSTKRYVQKIENDQSYLDALILFIREEQRHAHDLCKFMDIQGIPRIRTHWVDKAFRSLRRFAGLEVSVVVLLTAEIIATVYYEALKNATKSNTLIQICEQILKDEEKHVDFQSITLNKISSNRSPVIQIISRKIHQCLTYVTLMVVWIYHKKVFKAGGYSFKKYISSVMDEFYRSNRLIAEGRLLTQAS